MSIPETISQSESLCRKIAKSHYENFLVASALLPRRLRQPFFHVYAFCRTADDLADEPAEGETAYDPKIALKSLERLQAQLDDTFNDQPPPGIFPALHQTIAQFGLSKQPFDDLLSAFRQDQFTTRYESFEQLLDYCTRSANPVGRIVLQLAGRLNDDTAELSDHVCTGLQLVNFWQDVARDHEIGRIYLPRDFQQRYGVSESMFAGSNTPAELKQCLRELCDDAQRRFHLGMPLADLVPRWLSADIRLFIHGGLATADAIRKIDFDVLRVRPKVSKFRQTTLLIRAALRIL